MKQAKLICLSGLDASGKSTQIKLIKNYFEKLNIKYAHVHFPIYGDNEASNVVAAYLRGEYGDIDKVDPIFVANIYAMDRYLYLPKLQKLMTENDVVLLDRYVFCNMAFQGAKYDNDVQAKIMREWIMDFEFNFLQLPYPDLTIFFDVPIDIIAKRLEYNRTENREYLSGKQDIHEKDIQFQSRVRDNYLALTEYLHFNIVEGSENLNLLNPDQLFNKYKNLIDTILIDKIK